MQFPGEITLRTALPVPDSGPRIQHNHLEESAQYLMRRRGYVALQISASYASYMTGLMFHKYEEKPEEYRVYLCMSEPNNPYDADAIGIISDQNKRIAFAPRELSAELAARRFSGPSFVTVAYCTGRCSPKSVQCIYNVFQVVSPTERSIVTYAVSEHSGPYGAVQAAAPILSSTLPAQCVTCRGPADRVVLPCRHHVCCARCVSGLLGHRCPNCQIPVSATGPL